MAFNEDQKGWEGGGAPGAQDAGMTGTFDPSVWDREQMPARFKKWRYLDDTVNAGGDPNWAGVAADDPYAWRTTGSEDDRVGYTPTPRTAYNEWLRKKIRENLGADSKDAALAYGMQPGAGKWADEQAAAWGATAAPELYGAAEMRAGRGQLLDAMTAAAGGGLASDLQSRIRNEAAAMAAARMGGRGAEGLAGAQGALAERGMGEAVKERIGRQASLGEQIGAARSQELAESRRLQDWQLKREALRQKLLGRGLAQKQRRFDLLQRGWNTENALDMGEMQLAQQASAANLAREAGYLKSGGDLLAALASGGGKDRGEYTVPAESSPMVEESWTDDSGYKYSDF